MNQTYVPKNYRPKLDSYDTQRAISFIKKNFESDLTALLGLKRVSAPLFVLGSSGLNDDLSGKERAVSFDVPAVGDDAQVVHSLAKWKRLALHKYGFQVHTGLYTDMNAIRRDEDLDNIHSIYVDQWDWEKIIRREDRTLDYLKATVQSIINAICNVNDKLKVQFPQLSTNISRDVSFITSQELEDMYPLLSPEQREDVYIKKHPTTFIMQIGGNLKSGSKHGNRAPDYDDWTLNGDIIIYNEVLDRAFEISSMGIRVDSAALSMQLEISDCNERRELPFHKMLLTNELPLTIGGGIGQSRLCMLLMGCAHIGEVQSSIWDSETIKICEKNGIPLL